MVASDDVSRRLDEVRWSTEGLLAAVQDRLPGVGARLASAPSALTPPRTDPTV